MVVASLVQVGLVLPLIGEGVEGRCLCERFVRITMLAPSRQHDDTSVDLCEREIAHLPLERAQNLLDDFGLIKEVAVLGDFVGLPFRERD